MADFEFPAIVDFSLTNIAGETSRPAAERVLDGDPVQTVRNLFTDGTGQFFAGTWESTPGRWRVRYTENEFCYLTRGRIRVTDPKGNSWTFEAGRAFVVPAGFEGIWEVLDPAHKFYVVFEATRHTTAL